MTGHVSYKTRSLTPEEHALVKGFARAPSLFVSLVSMLWLVVFSGGVLFAVAVAIGFLAKVMGLSFWPYLALAASVCVFFIWVYLCLKEITIERWNHSADKKMAARFNQDTLAGIAEVAVLVSDQIIEVLEEEDEGYRFLYHINQDRVVPVREADAPTWRAARENMPNNHIEVAILTVSRSVISITALGDKVVPVAHVQPEQDTNQAPTGVPIQASWEGLLDETVTI